MIQAGKEGQFREVDLGQEVAGMGRAGGCVNKISGGTITGVLRGGGGLVTVGPEAGWVIVTGKVGEGGGISLGESTGREGQGGAGREKGRLFSFTPCQQGSGRDTGHQGCPEAL